MIIQSVHFLQQLSTQIRSAWDHLTHSMSSHQSALHSENKSFCRDSARTTNVVPTKPFTRAFFAPSNNWGRLIFFPTLVEVRRGGAVGGIAKGFVSFQGMNGCLPMSVLSMCTKLSPMFIWKFCQVLQWSTWEAECVAHWEKKNFFFAEADAGCMMKLEWCCLLLQALYVIAENAVVPLTDFNYIIGGNIARGGKAWGWKGRSFLSIHHKIKKASSSTLKV